MRDELRLLSQELIALHHRKFRRYFIEKTKHLHRLSIFIGQRGIGKTTTVIQYLLDYAKGDAQSEKILYIPVDHFLVRGEALFDIATQFVQMGGELIGFDEIHQYPNWSKELKSIYESFPKLNIIASGSSALEIHKGSHDLTRRAIVYQLNGMSFREFLSLQYQHDFEHYGLSTLLQDHTKIARHIISQLEKLNKKILREFSDYLLHGFYPYYFELNDDVLFRYTLEQNIHATLESDLISIYPALSGASIRKLKQLLAFIAGAVPFTPKWSEIQSLVDIGDLRTLKTYFKYLEDAQLIRMISGESTKMSKLKTSEKIYLDNPNMMQAIATSTANIGSLRELFFINMLSADHEIGLYPQGDFVVDHHTVFEIGGRKKDFQQINGVKNAYLALDQIEVGIENKIPLWLFGFLY